MQLLFKNAILTKDCLETIEKVMNREVSMNDNIKETSKNAQSKASYMKPWPSIIVAHREKTCSGFFESGATKEVPCIRHYGKIIRDFVSLGYICGGGDGRVFHHP